MSLLLVEEKMAAAEETWLPNLTEADVNWSQQPTSFPKFKTSKRSRRQLWNLHANHKPVKRISKAAVKDLDKALQISSLMC